MKLINLMEKSWYILLTLLLLGVVVWVFYPSDCDFSGQDSEITCNCIGLKYEVSNPNGYATMCLGISEQRIIID